MITRRRTRLVRVPDLHAFRHSIGSLKADSCQLTAVSKHPEPLVVVPTRGAARQLLRTLESAGGADRPDAVTRDQLYDRLHARLPEPPPRLSAFEREVIAQAAARDARAAVSDLPFRLRPGLVTEILRFYDLLRRQSQQVQRFEELIEQQLTGHMGTDPGADRLLQQTRFLAETFRGYERRASAASALDEHSLRARLMAQAAAEPIRHVIVAVADWIADPNGLYVADFDLLTRIQGLEALDIVATDALLGSGFHERLHTWLPGLEEVSMGSALPGVRPALVTPADPAGRLWFTRRDREEELIAAARHIKRDRGAAPIDRVAVVFKRPLPYLYLAQDTLGAAGIPYQISDALPLASEPTAAALDLIVDLVASGFSRVAIVSLLRSPHFQFAITRQEISALDRGLSDARYLGDIARLEDIAIRNTADQMRRPLTVALDTARPLTPLAKTRSASRQLRDLTSFFETHARPLEDDDPLADRERRARAAILDALGRLAAAYATHDDPVWTIDDLAGAVRRWIEEETFIPAAGSHGAHLVDDEAARFGAFDDITIVGVIEGDWPERPRRNIFYPSNLMKALGWPSEKDRRAAEEARFLDLLSSAAQRVTLSTVTLDDEALVEPSSLLDEVPRARLSAEASPANGPARVFLDEALTLDPVVAGVLTGEARGWAEMRPGRSPHDAPDFHGAVGVQTPRKWSVSALETYLGCPFRFFAQHILRLEEEPDDEEVMDPRRQGLFVHEVFEKFFETWQAQGRGAITPENLGDARDLFGVVVDRQLDRLSSAEAGLERTRLLGSPAAAGLGEAVLRMEAERPVAVVERLLEHSLTGPLTIQTESGTRVVELKGKADRVDLLADGTFRVIDYKLGWPPNRARALQLPIYSLCVEQQLAGRAGRSWTLGEAVYLAFKGPRRVVPLFTTAAERADVLSRAQVRLADTIDKIERGDFPPTPDDVYRCETCSFSAVCRKDYVGDV